MTIIIEQDPSIASTLNSGLGGTAIILSALEAGRRHLDENPDELNVIVGPSLDVKAAGQFTEALRVSRPDVGVVLVRRRVDTSVLAEALRSGFREVAEERDLEALAASVRRSAEVSMAMRARAGHESDDDHKRGKVITVFSAKGGCGKTTTSTNLAAVLAENGKRRVVILDLDLAFGDVAIALQQFPAHTIADAIPLGETIDAAAVTSLLTPHSPGLWTLVAPMQPDAKDSITAGLIGRIIDLLRASFDIVVIDTPPAFDDQVLMAFDHSDLVLLLTTLDVPALKNLKLTIETLELLDFSRDRWSVVLNRADAKVGLSPAEVEKTLRAPIAASIPSSRDVPAAINRGVPIVLDNPGHPVSEAFRHLATVALQGASVPGESGPAAIKPRRGGFLRRKTKTP